jgi:hypothetical protein
MAPLVLIIFIQKMNFPGSIASCVNKNSELQTIKIQLLKSYKGILNLIQLFYT